MSIPAVVLPHCQFARTNVENPRPAAVNLAPKLAALRSGVLNCESLLGHSARQI